MSAPNPTGESRVATAGWPVVRLAVQIFFLVLVVGPAVLLWVGLPPFWPADLLARADPLLAVVASVAARDLVPWLLLALGVLVATLVFGRFFCGWVCPVGTLCDLIGKLAPRKKSRKSLQCGVLRFGLLAALLAAALFGANLAGWIDPLALLPRALHLAPGVLALSVPALAAAGILAFAVGSSWFSPRWWCRAICPLGALFSLAARFSLLRRHTADNCNSCGLCQRRCPAGATASGSEAADCLLCLQCIEVCPRAAVSFGFGPPSPGQTTPASKGLPRRGFLFCMGGLAVGALAAHWLTGRNAPAVLRPPGAGDEAEFLARCVGCGVCISACPSGGLRPQLDPHALDAAFSPEFVPRLGDCPPDCTVCGQVCPTGAIPRLPVATKASTRIGVARIDRERCLSWSPAHKRCSICADACPQRPSAISLRRRRGGQSGPRVIESRCTGCGACELNCPLEGPAAIRVFPVAAGAMRPE